MNERKGVPRWVWLVVIGLLVAVLVIVVLRLSGHQPRQHGEGGPDAADAVATVSASYAVGST